MDLIRSDYFLFLSFLFPFFWWCNKPKNPASKTIFSDQIKNNLCTVLCCVPYSLKCAVVISPNRIYNFTAVFRIIQRNGGQFNLICIWADYCYISNYFRVRMKILKSALCNLLFMIIWNWIVCSIEFRKDVT